MPLIKKLDIKFLLLTIGLLLGVLLSYANHFHNVFQFDDAHTIINNVYIRDIRNIPKFFTGEALMSSLPFNASYRPVFAASAALDYWIGDGLNPFIFHLSSFFWFLVQGFLMFFMYKKILDTAGPHPWNSYVSLFAAGWYLVHPANAETINYISARSDSYSTLGVIAGFVLYQYFPRGRKFGIYLLPVIIAGLTKPIALVFAPLLSIYILLFESIPTSPENVVNGKNIRLSGIFHALTRSLPAWGLCIGLLIFTQFMTPDSFKAEGLNSQWNYLITQPFVIFRYFRVFFFPWDLSADTDWNTFESWQDERVWAGAFFMVALVACALWARRGNSRPISFGLFWFLIALLPTSSFYPLAEVTNDHRMFFPFVGLTLAISWILRNILIQNESNIMKKRAGTILLCLAICYILSFYAGLTIERNKVWHTEESLWHDVTLKSPKNGRGLMNYGLTQMSKGRFETALSYFEKALIYTPQYAHLHINLGVVKSSLNRQAEAEQHFIKAVQYAPQYDGSFFHYGRWLSEQKRTDEAIPLLEKAVSLAPGLESRHLLMKLYAEKSEWKNLSQLAHETLKLSPEDKESLQYLKAYQDQKF